MHRLATIHTSQTTDGRNTKAYKRDRQYYGVYGHCVAYCVAFFTGCWKMA